MKYTIIIERAENNFSAYSPDVPGCVATGKTEEEVMERMKEALEFHLEGLRDIDMEIPRHRATVREIEVRI